MLQLQLNQKQVKNYKNCGDIVAQVGDIVDGEIILSIDGNGTKGVDAAVGSVIETRPAAPIEIIEWEMRANGGWREMESSTAIDGWQELIGGLTIDFAGTLPVAQFDSRLEVIANASTSSGDDRVSRLVPVVIDGAAIALEFAAFANKVDVNASDVAFSKRIDVLTIPSIAGLSTDLSVDAKIKVVEDKVKALSSTDAWITISGTFGFECQKPGGLITSIEFEVAAIDYPVSQIISITNFYGWVSNGFYTGTLNPGVDKGWRMSLPGGKEIFLAVGIRDNGSFCINASVLPLGVERARIRRVKINGTSVQ